MPVRSLFPSFSPMLWAVIGFVLLLVSLSNDSIDMDEAQTWDYARLDTFSEFCHELKNDPNSEAQMPLGMFSFWAWSRAFGTGELAMRSLNLLWAAITLAALARAGRQLSIPWLPLLFAIQPFAWYCMNQARAPLMQMAGGSLLIAGALGFIRKEFQDGMEGPLFCGGAILLCGASMLGLLPLTAVVAGVVLHGIRRWDAVPGFGKILLLVTLGVLGLLGVYYGSTLLRGAGGTRVWSVSPANMLFVGYEFWGFQGIGPGRQELRAMMKGVVRSRELLPYVPGFLAFLATYIILLAASYKSWMTRGSHTVLKKAGLAESTVRQQQAPPQLSAWLMGIGVTIASMGLLYGLASLVGFPFWGRHLAGAFPFWVLSLAITIHWARQGLWRVVGRFAAGGLLVLLLASSLLIRFAPWHEHDDYRRAAAEALRLSATGHIVWWVADHSGGAYYGLPLVDAAPDAPGKTKFAANRSVTPPVPPGAIIISRPDSFDVSGTAVRLLRSGDYKRTLRLQAFEVWEKI